LDNYEEPPLDALAYLTSECNYGGRVTDDHDRRLIKSLLNKYYCKDVLFIDNYKFSTLDEYYVLNDLSYDGYVDYIRQMPLIVHPEIFGLHENANISRDYKETQQLFDGILLTLPRQNTNGGNSSQSMIEDLAKDILNRLPDNFDLEAVQVSKNLKKKQAVIYFYIKIHVFFQVKIPSFV
jgi:dynein heavy chain